ncbi:hypothetical protein PoMZ_12901 [Pyricularia oryzae]|uniref:Uncharacterized protein n=1 Tax=Pyricularia oryzae TaxID=318829 RepID=A0A4P7NTR8_PYROR|nr:hypothetical protein PoMZ_12901 [Pyricularia oryzae]
MSCRDDHHGCSTRPEKKTRSRQLAKLDDWTSFVPRILFHPKKPWPDGGRPEITPAAARVYAALSYCINITPLRIASKSTKGYAGVVDCIGICNATTDDRLITGC